MASEGLNKCMLIGNLGADPELRYGQGGGAVLRLRVAATEKFVKKDGERGERTEWATVVFFGNRAEGLNKHLSKGQTVFVEGRLQTRKWEDKDGRDRYTTEIVGTNLLFLGGGNKSGGQRQERREEADYGGGAGDWKGDEGGGDFGDDDIPFMPVDGRLV